MGGARSSGAGEGTGPKVVATKTGPMRIHPKRRKNILDEIPTLKLVGRAQDAHNMRRRKKFVSKLTAEQKSKITSLDDDYLITPDAKRELDALGYTRPSRINDNNRDDDNTGSVRSTQQPKVASQMDNTNIVSDGVVADRITTNQVAKLTPKEEAILVKRKGKKQTIETSVLGDTDEVTLGKKRLLG